MEVLLKEIKTNTNEKNMDQETLEGMFDGDRKYYYIYMNSNPNPTHHLDIFGPHKP